MNKFLKNIAVLSILIGVLVLPCLVFATNGPLETLEKVGPDSGYQPVDEFTIANTAGFIVSILLSLLGIIFVGLIIYGGILWMTAQGNEDQVTKAKNILKNSIIGLIITVSAFAIYNLISVVFSRVLK